MRCNVLSIIIMLSGIALSGTASAADSDLDITINVVGPNQNIQGSIENRITIPKNQADHQLAGAGSNSPGNPDESQDSETEQSTQQTQDSTTQTQQQEQQATQDATQQTEPDN